MAIAGAEDCRLPPRYLYNVFDYRPEEQTFETIDPYVSSVDDLADVNHRVKTSESAPGNWLTRAFTLHMATDPELESLAHLRGSLFVLPRRSSLIESYVSIENVGESPIFFGLSPSVLDKRIEPKQHLVIPIGTAAPTPTVRDTRDIIVKYWHSTGPSPRCMNVHDYLEAVSAMGESDFEVSRKTLSWQTYPAKLLGQSGGVYTYSFGPYILALSQSKKAKWFLFTNTSTEPLILLCGFDRKPHLYEPGQTAKIEGAEGSAWHESSMSSAGCQVGKFRGAGDSGLRVRS